MGLFDKLRSKKPKVNKDADLATGLDDTLWSKCPNCDEVLHHSDLADNWQVCSHCDWHLKLSALQRIELLTDEGSFQEWDGEIISGDPMSFGEEYVSKLEKDRKKTGLSDSIITGKATLDDLAFALGVMDFGFRGGSMGSVVGEKICRMVERSIDERIPVVMVTSSGGARMQEGILSLMQMARTSAALQRLAAAGLPYIVILTDPTTAGVAASYASLGDIIIAEPKAIIGFSGARVIEQTIRKKLPPGFQTSEFYKEHGFIDDVIERGRLREYLSRLLGFFVVPKEEVSV